MTRFFRVMLLTSLALTTACTSVAATVTATPDTFQRTLNAARAGDTIVLAAGDYAPLRLRSRDWTPAVVVDARAARLTGIRLDAVSGLTWRGGDFNGRDGSERIGFAAIKSRRLAIEGTTMHGYLRTGIAFTEVSDTRIANNKFTDMGSDGMSLAMSRRLVIDGNTCRAFKMSEKAHPDCIQLWSRPTAPPTADITIINNVIDGDMQGISMFNHARDGVDDGGFDRVTVKNNRVRGTFGNGIALSSCRGCVVRDNVIETLPEHHDRVRLVIRGTGDVAACNNIARGTPVSQGQERCRN